MKAEQHQCFWCGRWYTDDTPAKRARHFASRFHIAARWGAS